MVFDICIIGGGIVGLATALRLSELFPQAALVVLEKEEALARHQSGHNSGVLHAGVYYAPGSLKARFCREGVVATLAFCREHGLPIEQCGKLLVATSEAELERMAALEARARENGLEIERLDAAGLARREPNIAGLGALLVPTTGIVDYGLVARAMAGVVAARGGEIRLGTAVLGLGEGADAVTVETSRGTLAARHVVACGGLQADRLARMGGLDPDFRVVPFRGDFFRLNARHDAIIRHLIYPIPDPALPFLGVHLTRLIGGGVTVGPNAVLALAREGYGRLSFNPADVAGMLAFRGFWKLVWAHRRTAVDELASSLSKRRYLALCRKYCPSLELDDLEPHPSGVRAQAVAPDGTLIHDFLIRRTARTTHVCNAPSPAATASIPIGRHVAGLVAEATGARTAVPVAAGGAALHAI